MALRTVDVVVPCYNYGAYLEGCVQSLLTQEGAAVRVLVIDDASTDETPQVGARLAASDPRVTYRRHATNKGHIATYNEGLLGWASADYVLLISADDLLTPGALHRAVSVLEQHPSATFAHGRQIAFKQTPPAIPHKKSSEAGQHRMTPGLDFIGTVCVDAQNPVATPTAVVRTWAQHAVGGYDPTLPHTADLEMWLRLAAMGDVVQLEADQALKRMHGQNMQLAFLTTPERDIDERREAFAAFLGRYGTRLADPASAQRQVDIALANELFWSASRLLEAGDRNASDRLLNKSVAMYPPLAGSSQWRRMALKRRIGPWVWALIHRLAGRVERWA